MLNLCGKSEYYQGGGKYKTMGWGVEVLRWFAIFSHGFGIQMGLTGTSGVGSVVVVNFWFVIFADFRFAATGLPICPMFCLFWLCFFNDIVQCRGFWKTGSAVVAGTTFATVHRCQTCWFSVKVFTTVKVDELPDTCPKTFCTGTYAPIGVEFGSILNGYVLFGCSGCVKHFATRSAP